MAMKPLLSKEDFDKLPDHFKAEYSLISGTDPNAGKYQLQVVESDGLKLASVDKLLSALGAERDRADAAEKKSKAFGDLTPEAAREAITSLAALAAGTPDGKTGQIIQLREKTLRGEFETQLAAERTKVKDMEAALQTTLVETAAIRAISDTDPKASVELLLPIVTRSLKVVKTDDGKFVTRVVDANGIPRVKDAQGTPLSPVDFVAEIRKVPAYAGAFGGTGSTGMGTSGASSSGGASGGAKRRIFANDMVAVSANLEAIAKGEAELVYGDESA